MSVILNPLRTVMYCATVSERVTGDTLLRAFKRIWKMSHHLVNLVEWARATFNMSDIKHSGLITKLKQF